VSCSAKVKPTPLARNALDYSRQSTTQQVLNNRESTARQYALDQRAMQLGWPADAVVIVDEDQGLSGQTAEGRSGFAYLLSQVALNRVGIILGLETSRRRAGCGGGARRVPRPGGGPGRGRVAAGGGAEGFGRGRT
jgi:hypothetical protein